MKDIRPTYFDDSTSGKIAQKCMNYLTIGATAYSIGILGCAAKLLLKDCGYGEKLKNKAKTKLSNTQPDIAKDIEG